MAPGPLRVTLRRPVPLELPLRIEPPEDGALVAGDGDGAGARRWPSRRAAGRRRVATGRPRAGARRAAATPALVARAPVPACFGCGPLRDPAEAVALQVGPVGDGVWATAWTPGAGLAARRTACSRRRSSGPRSTARAASPRCPRDRRRTCSAGIEGETLAPVHVGEEVVVLAWPLGHEGRKRWGATAICGAGGDLRARARATWIALA